VGSRTLTRKYGFNLSPATVRNVLADLEEGGYLRQPHPSSGRVPTEAAFRLFIDVLMRSQQVSSDQAAKIAGWLAELEPGQDILRQSGKLLCELTDAPAVLARPRAEARPLLRIRFIPTRPGELLSVLVFTDGTVENRFIRVDQEPSERQLERLHNLLADSVEGHTLVAVRENIARMLDQQRGELATLSELGLSLVDGAIEFCGRRSMDVVIEGQSRLLDRPEFANANRVRELLSALDDRERLVSLLDQTLTSTCVQVYLGNETSPALGAMSLVVAPYQDHDGRPGGAVGIIGPTRMDYPCVVPLVGATADAVGSALARRHDAARAAGNTERRRTDAADADDNKS
jgi:heat-inducible transcriptional repressor